MKILEIKPLKECKSHESQFARTSFVKKCSQSRSQLSSVVLHIFFWVLSVGSWFCEVCGSTRSTVINQRSTICKQDLKMQALRTVQSYQYCIKCPINHTQERHIRDSSIWHHGRVLKICTALIYHYKYVDIIPFEDHNIKSPFLAPI